MIDFDTFKKLIETGEPITVNVKGNSMRPFLMSDSDSVIAVCADNQIKKGDICFFYRMNKTVVMHRVVRIDGNKCWFCGDSQKSAEGPIDKNCILAKVISVIHNGKKYDENSFYFRFFSEIWTNILIMRNWINRG